MDIAKKTNVYSASSTLGIPCVTLLYGKMFIIIQMFLLNKLQGRKKINYLVLQHLMETILFDDNYFILTVIDQERRIE